MKKIFLLSVILGLAGCGGGSDRGAGQVRAVQPVAAGPLATACLQSDRAARSAALCGCIQAVADRTLSGSEQRRAVSFYKDPHSAQEIRQSDRVRDRSFWRSYTEYALQAERVCTA
ncbi:hypothetical protein [Roseovarius sp. D22-M7]|uniref:hypothetical protein n=1 Tax=Roseovarius sp. D22-M7 TaxID=3127116 RepID=UPI00300FE8B4